jgi:hypothetical protein
MSMAMGNAGCTLLLLVFAAVGASLFFGFSWLHLAERVGAAIEKSIRNLIALREARADRKVGQAKQAERNESVVVKQEQLVHEQPVRIEPAITSVPRSERVEKEKQKTLFSAPKDTASSGDLPAISLLDMPEESTETVSPETIEYTSRLIEKKLSDFGVKVVVVAAQAGPVITRYEIEPATGVKGSQIVNLAKDLARALSLISIRVVETIPGAAQSQAADGQAVGDHRFPDLSCQRIRADHGVGQGHCGQPRRGRPGQDAAPAGGGHHGFGQVGRDQCHDPVAALQGGRQPGASDPDRPEDAGNERLRGDSPSACAGGDRYAARRQCTELVRGRDGEALPAHEQDGCAQPGRLQQQDP